MKPMVLKHAIHSDKAVPGCFFPVADGDALINGGTVMEIARQMGTVLIILII